MDGWPMCSVRESRNLGTCVSRVQVAVKLLKVVPGDSPENLLKELHVSGGMFVMRHCFGSGADQLSLLSPNLAGYVCMRVTQTLTAA
jgi:hypothetical protein